MTKMGKGGSQSNKKTDMKYYEYVQPLSWPEDDTVLSFDVKVDICI